ncbi:helix-turn-helix transcriptional regulator [Tumebacillus sp. ITR2]|uniref:Helix-turn-helix transcriptional regulator n=1 Tax=Tumebacillus amylolyticus TaxID=2801339 RepID=A0ABS1JDK8_9BACL|nr:helix-turn-helix transcriptional regulator [Tumebacillus amylolyticus]MBL0388319.1 helix-turn-helix transcriptional regulator [Tumebacillus amylolyticus]
MSTVERMATSEIEKVSLTRRISELMQEKGEAYSLRGFSQRLGINRETLRLFLTGQRRISSTRLEQIAQGLRMSVERLKQTDTVKLEQDLAVILKANKRTKPMMIRALAMATELVHVAQGATERGYALLNLGRVHYLQKDFDESHELWLQALEHAKYLHEEYDERDLLNKVTANLMLTYTIRKEYSNVENFLCAVEAVFADDPLQLGMAQYTRMTVCEERGKLERAKEHAYRSYEYLKQTGSQEQIGHALINMAHCEYRLGKYQISAKLLSEAMSALADYENILILAVKEYVKSLMQLRDYSAVTQLVEKYSTVAKSYPEYWARLQIMNARATGNPALAEAVTNEASVSLRVRYFACKSLMEFYTLHGDFESAARYYEKSRIYSNQKSEYLNEGGF